ncbi:hypothetical protein GCM10022291_31780 [Postechiella marina]|uniref:WD40 repeat protein n=1 Tax=Postechiella marina TaxID=943941 RepID=A0ABP8CH62_9FLAO
MKHFYKIIYLIGLVSFSQNLNYNLTNLKINDDRPHYSIKYAQGNKVVFTSYLLSKNGKVKKSGGSPVIAVYEGAVSPDGQITNHKPIEIDSKQLIGNVTSATFSRDGKQLFLSAHYNAKDKPKGTFKATNFTIKVGEYVNGKGWTNFKVLPFCKPRYSYGHPVFSTDGKTMYFIANIRGGKETTKGGSDIFKVNVLENGSYSEPKNLGSKVNSYSREMFPFVSNDNTLYLSSDRSNGYGGFDLYRCKMLEDGTFAKAEKMPKPINSVKDDFNFIINSSNSSGYLSSKRLKGKGDDDIYYFKVN